MRGCDSAQTGFCASITNTLALLSCFFFSKMDRNLCVFVHTTVVPPSAMATAVILGWNSRVCSGGDHHEGLRHVRLRHYLLRRARLAHPQHSSEHRGQLYWALSYQFLCHKLTRLPCQPTPHLCALRDGHTRRRTCPRSLPQIEFLMEKSTESLTRSIQPRRCGARILFCTARQGHGTAHCR